MTGFGAAARPARHASRLRPLPSRLSAAPHRCPPPGSCGRSRWRWPRRAPGARIRRGRRSRLPGTASGHRQRLPVRSEGGGGER
ncbi:hypothetical protein AX27061_2938 [Achromobacter xylosoxidans NBRC 15126 = ATCC 27061]|nr:hypothetical protein AX27061_2938 [Achromobacter xylosoxidans NBRC 15126 = ATCC 27061]